MIPQSLSETKNCLRQVLGTKPRHTIINHTKKPLRGVAPRFSHVYTCFAGGCYGLYTLHGTGTNTGTGARVGAIEKYQGVKEFHMLARIGSL